MLRSMYSGVTGLRSHQTKMDVIANNISNVNTTAFKSSRVTFQDVYYQTLQNAAAPSDTQAGSNPTQIGYGAMVSSIDILTARGGVQLTDKPLDLYIAGDGYFIIQDSSGGTLYTRAGNFSFDAMGNLVDGNGNKVCGWMPSKKEAEAAAAAAGMPMPEPTPIKIEDLLAGITINDYSNIAVAPDGTISAIYNGPAPAHIPGKDETLGKIIDFALNAKNYADIKLSINGTVMATYSGNTHINGNTETLGTIDISAFDVSYNPANYTNFTISENGIITADYVGPTRTVGATENLGTITGFALNPDDYTNFSIAADGTVKAIYNVNPPAAGHDFGVEEDLGIIPGFSELVTNFTNIKVAADGTVTGDYIGVPHTNGKAEVIGVLSDLELPSDLYGDIAVAADGTVTAQYLGQTHIKGTIENLGQLDTTVLNITEYENLRLGDDGSIIAAYNGPAPDHIPGKNEVLGQIALAKFTNPEGLTQMGNSYYSASPNTGTITVTNPGANALGTLTASALEMSNVDLSKEFTDMITTQRGFQANSRIITVSDEILQELVNLKR